MAVPDKKKKDTAFDIFEPVERMPMVRGGEVAMLCLVAKNSD